MPTESLHYAASLCKFTEARRFLWGLFPNLQAHVETYFRSEPLMTIFSERFPIGCLRS